MNDYGWTTGRGLVLVDGELDRVRTVWREKKEIKIVNKQAATVESLIDGHPVKNVFHELLEPLFYAFSDGVISEEEFLILYGAASRNMVSLSYHCIYICFHEVKRSL